MIRLLCDLAAPRRCYLAGEIVDWADAADAARLIAAGLAAPVRDDAIGTAAVRPNEAAVRRRKDKQ